MDDRQIQAGISATLSEDAQLKAATLRNNFASVAGTSPDDFAKQKALSEASGISLPHLLANPDVARTQSALKDTDFSGLVMESPKTAGFLENPIHAGISRDDTDNLSAMESTTKRLKSVFGALGDVIPTINVGVWGLAQAASEHGIEPFTNLAGSSTGRDISGYFARLRRQAEDASTRAQNFGGDRKDMGVVERGLYNAITSATMSALTLPAALEFNLAKGGLALSSAAKGIAPLAAVQGGQSYGEARDKSVGPKTALAYAGAQAATEMWTEMIPMGTLINDLNVGSSLFKTLKHQFISENIGEQFATHFQDLNKWLTVDPTRTIGQYLEERPNAALETLIATTFATGMQTTAAHVTARTLQGDITKRDSAAQGAAGFAELFAAAANSLTGKRSPATLDAFIEHLAPGATVLIDPVKLNEVLSQSGVDLGVLPTAAAQMAEGEIGGSGIEIPVSELVTGLTGTGAEKSIVNHLRMAPDMPTLAEAQDFDSKAAEFFQTEADRILEQESKNADFTAAAQAVHDDLFTQLTAVGRHGPQVNTSYAKLGAAFYTTLANKLGVTPLQVRDGWTDSDGGVHRGYALKIGGDPSDAPQLSQGFSHGQAMLNIGLDVGATDRAQKIDAAFAKQEIEKLGVQVLSGAEVVGEYELDGAQVQEKTYVPHLSRPLTEAETTQLAEALGQEAIGHYYNGTGNLWGPNASAWGEFAPGFFKDQEGNSLLSYQERGLAQAMAAYRAPEKRNEKGDLLAPNGKPSNLDERQWHIVRSPQFKEWFGDWEAGDVWARGDVSKVVDANGEPLVVYHGTKTGGFTTFRPDKADEHRTPMIFTAATRDTASTYAGSHSDIALGQDPKTQADFEERGFSFDETEAGQYEVYDPNWRLIAEGVSLTQALQEAADEFKYNGNSYEHDNQRGVYPLFLNIRNPNEAYFEGANWDGTVYDKYEVRDLRNEDPIYGSNGSRFFATAADARAAAELAGIDESDYEVTPAQNLWETTNSVAEDAKRYGNDGAIIRETTDDGGHGGHADVDDIFVFFKPNQAKSATQNLGAFSTTDDNILHQSQSTRRPTTKRAPEDHLGEVPLTVDYTKIEPEKNAQNMALVAKYPGLRFKARDPAKRVEEFIQHATDNLLWLHDQIPADIRNRSKLWYDGARTITERWATKYNKTDAQIAAVLAVYSPQRDWFMNVSLAERTLDIVKNQQNTPWSPEMSKVSTTILSKEQFALLRAQIEGKTLSQLTDRFEQAAWLRVYDEAHNNRGHRLVTPEGGLGEFVRNGKDVDAKTGWPGFATIIKALYVIEDGSAATIDAALGAEHKVRSFYNNIFHPNSDQGFVTIDTHAVAAALLRPLSGDTLEVLHNFGRSGAAQSAATGMSGTYPYYQEAYRRAAEARGLLPRELQSITWEAVRELYTMGFKHDKAKLTALDKIWSEYEKGKRNIDDVRDQVLKLAGGIEHPAWIGRDSGLSPTGFASTYTDELLGRSAPGTDGRGTRRGNRGVAAQGTSEVLSQSAPLIRAGAVSAPVVGVHFSKQARGMLNSGYFGTGTKGAEAERLAQSNDPRIKQRIAFYIDEGSGVHPEPGVGGVAHVATLSNLYDADADTLKIFRRNQRDLNAAESAVLDAGFDGYLQRKNFTNQGTAVLLGSRGVDAEHVGGVEEANARATIPPPADIPAMKTLAIQLMNDRTLPGGALLPSEWKAELMKKDSPLVRLIDFDQFNPDERIYKDQLAGALWQTSETWYYSQLTRAIENASEKVFTTGKSAAQWLTANAGKLGVKKEELEFTGITDWLDLQPKVTKADVVAFMQQGGVKVEEVMLGGLPPIRTVEQAKDYLRERFNEDPEERYGYSNQRDYIQIANDWLAGEGTPSDSTKFSSYVLPGGENYRELLITLPADTATLAEQARIRQLRAEGGRAYAAEPRGVFRSSHFDQPNILAHVRFNERTDAEGARVLFVEEVQSDWGQKGKKDGFGVERETKPVSEGEYSDFMTRMKDAAAEELVRRGAGQVTLDTARVIANSQPILAVAEWAGMTAEYADIQARQDEDYQIDQRGRGAVPSAPFVTDTKAWTGLAVKRILAYAAENGFDKVAWTTGEQQAERYDLSKQVSGISYRNAKNGEGYEVQVIGDKANTIWSSEHATASELEDVVGKEIAKKIADGAKAEWANLSGIDLKVGGEGMHAYYDQILPQVVRDVLKKVGGGQVETIAVSPKPRGEPNIERLSNLQQPGFAITPAMREAVSKGLPLFQPGQEAPKLGSFSPLTLDLRLLANADYSTFVHELGHFFLTAYADIAAQEGAPQSIVDDMNVILKQFGVADLATWNAMTLEQQRPYHEQLAESFEQYVFTGKAPSLELQPLFSTMLSWFKKVYQSVKDFVAGHPGAKLNPELSAIFDRMLATDAEIAAANAARGYVALFKDAAEAGMSDKAFAAYTALDDAQREDAESMLRTRSLRDMKWLQARRNKIIAALQEDAKEKRAEVRKEIAAEVKAEPIRQAERYLKHGVILNEVGADIAPLGPNKLQISEVKALFPEEALTPQPDFTKLNYGKYGLLAEVGLSPEEVATRFGIESGTDLVTELLNLPKINDDIEARTDQAMLERYGDLSSPDAIARAADEAIHNDFRTRAVATELSALAANIGPASVLMKAAKEYARQVLETKTSKTLKPWSYAAAETRAGKAAMAALKKGDREQAAIEKRTELVNHVTAKESYAVEKEIKAIVAKFKKLAAYNDKSSAVKSRDFATVQALRVILADHGVGVSKGVPAGEYLETVKEHDPAAFARLSELVAVTGEEPKHWTEITVANLRNLAEAVDDIWFAAARTRQMEVQGKMVSQEAIAAELLETLVAQGIPDRVPGEGWAPTKAEKRKMKFGAMKAQWQRMEFIASKLDGNRAVGPWLKNIISVVQDGLNNMNVVKADVMSQYAALLDTIAPTLKNGEINAPELGYLFGKEGSGMIELLHAILHTGNESNMRKMLLGRGWAVERQDKSLDTSKWDAFITRMIAEGRITKAHYDFAQGVWNLMESLKDDAQKAHRAVFGKFFATVTAQPFTNSFGTYAGGYVPALTDSDIVHDREVEKLRDAATHEMGVAFPEPPKGFTNKRVTNYNRELKLDLRSLGAHINQVLLFSHMAVPVADIRRVLSRPEISGAINRLYPGMIVNAINPWLVRVARNTVSPLATDMTRFIRMARSRAGANTMMGSISNSVQQITGIIPATVAIDSKYLRRALVDVISHPVDTTEMVKELSVYMRTRIDNEVNAAMDNVEQLLVNPNVYQSVVDWTRRHAYFMQSAVDSAISPTLWLAAYNQAKDKNPRMSDEDAVHIADAMIRKTQGASGSADIATFEAGHPFVQLFTQFTGYFNMMAQFLQGEWVKNLARDVGLPKKYARAFYIVGIGFYAQAVAAELISMLFRGGPDDEDKDGAIIDDWLFQLGVMAPVKFATATVPFLGSALMVALNKWNSKPYDDKMMNSPAVSAIEGALGAPVDVYKALFEDGKPSKAIRSVAGIGGLFGLPTALAARPIGYVADAATGHINPTSELDTIRGILTGTASPDSKR